MSFPNVLIGNPVKNKPYIRSKVMTTIFTKDSLRASTEAATGGKVTVLYDDLGYPSYMCVIPKFNVEDIDPLLGAGVHPAFMVGGIPKSEIFIGQYQAKVLDGRAQSIPGQDPTTSLNFVNSKLACTSKGPGWHIMTNWEWAAIALWCIKNGFQSRGNTSYGRSHEATYETAVRNDGGDPGNTSGVGRTTNGSGPASWRHNNTHAGIADLTGNIWERVDGLKTNNGEIFMPNDNDYTLAENSWSTQGMYFQANSGTITLDNVIDPTPEDGGINTNWNAIDVGSTVTASEIGKLSKALVSPKDKGETGGVVIPALSTAKGACAASSSGEFSAARSSYWGGNTNAGLFTLALNITGSTVSTSIGFRVAFIN